MKSLIGTALALYLAFSPLSVRAGDMVYISGPDLNKKKAFDLKLRLEDAIATGHNKWGFDLDGDRKIDLIFVKKKDGIRVKELYYIDGTIALKKDGVYVFGERDGYIDSVYEASNRGFKGEYIREKKPIEIESWFRRLSGMEYPSGP